MFEVLKNLKDKADDLAEEHGDKIVGGLEKLGGFVDDKTDGKHSDRIDSAVDTAQDYIGKLGERKG
ncbi:antitoxin [Streptomyces sp. HB132]|uniref:antitoxin n=1 Tax=Streptomyces sp. HB132 TaxID=767388 RepID=UPI001960F17F|nr:antitoxin [Streptomyces sp. HB132]MBM7440093.1 hypothetical protein [Streptomyces sp. HB132]